MTTNLAKSFCEEFLNTEKFWFANDLTIDKYLVDKYLPNGFDTFDSMSGLLTCEEIIWCDQIIRHAKRILNSEKYEEISRKNISIAAYYLTTNGLIKNEIDEYINKMNIFMLLAVRHGKELIHFEHIIIPLMQELIGAGYFFPDRSMIDNRNTVAFIKVTLNVYKDLAQPDYPAKPKYFLSNTKYLDDMILFSPDFNKKIFYVNDTNHNICVAKLESEYLSTNNCIRKMNLAVHNTKQFLDQYLLSLSGGVDSTAALLMATCNKDINIIGAVHINYGNRPESDDEEEYCRRLCHLYDIPLVVRKINEIKRVQSKQRNFYEEYTEQVRFATYKYAWSKLCTNGEKVPVIMLGHNKDDVEENIFSNIAKGRCKENLSGMKTFCEKNGVILYRPFLEITKVNFILMLHEFRTPHVMNSTPTWSERGKLRNEILPVVSDYIDGIVDIAQSYSRLLQKSFKKIDSMVGTEIIFNGNICELRDAAIQECDDSQECYEHLLMIVVTHFKIPYISRKSIENLMRSLNNQTVILSPRLRYTNVNGKVRLVATC